MASVALFPAVALVAGAALALATGGSPWPTWPLGLLTAIGWAAWWLAPAGDAERFAAPQGLVAAILAAGFLYAGAALAADAGRRALHTPLRALLDREIGGFAIDRSDVPERHDPLAMRAVLSEDAAPRDDFTTLRARVAAVRFRDAWVDTAGGVLLTVGGRAPPGEVLEWRAGRTIETFVTFRRPATYLNTGVPDFEHDLALDGTTLFGSVKSPLLVEVRAHGTFAEELAADIRRHARDSVRRRVGGRDAVAGAIVTAILIGDRTGLPDEIRQRLQAGGTYHVIAISGGNIAILAGVTLGVLFVCGVRGRLAAVITLLVLIAYAVIVTSEPSVWRATLMAVLYLGARLLGHRSPPWQALALAAVLLVAIRPLDVRDPGFILTFGATAALMEAARRAARLRPRSAVAGWLVTSVIASAAVEMTLLPVSAHAFSRVTGAGLVLNLAAVPLMTVVQLGGMTAVLVDRVDAVSNLAGWAAYAAADALVSSARLIEVAPWLAARVAPPPIALIATYYGGLALAAVPRSRVRRSGAVVLLLSTVAIVTGQPAAWLHAARHAQALRITMFDVGQGESVLLRFPDTSTLLVDAGGVPFGGGFDVGSRVLAPALWAMGLRRLDTLLLTHGHPDHAGGARAMLGDFSPSHFWEGIPVPAHPALQELLERAQRGGTDIGRRQAGERFVVGGVRVHVLHPEEPDWERQRVRNDDSVVLELLYGDVAVLMLGDVGAAVERALVPRLTHARTRILKVAHHGSRTSTSRELVEQWRPRIAIISAGRGNTFGHPSPDVLRRLEAVGATIYRTDVDGQITIDTDGRAVSVRTRVQAVVHRGTGNVGRRW